MVPEALWSFKLRTSIPPSAFVASELLDLGKLHQTWSRLSKGAVKREVFHYYLMEREDKGSDEICF